MSADNYNYVRKIGDDWHVWLNLSASIELPSQIDRTPDGIFGDRAEAVTFADESGYTEYGTQVDERSRVNRDKRNRAKLGRERAGLSVEQAALLLGVPVGVLDAVEELEPAQANFDFRRLADLYQCRIEWLTGEVPRCDFEAIDSIKGADKLTHHDRDVLAEFAASMPRRKL